MNDELSGWLDGELTCWSLCVTVRPAIYPYIRPTVRLSVSAPISD